ncbi:MAG: hypothetical protein ACXV9R_10635, partial [Methylobacter sp.]
GSRLAWAGGYYTCTSPAVLKGTSSCSDGSPALFNADPVCPTPQILQNHSCITSGTGIASDTETILNWAELYSSQYFSSRNTTITLGPWLYRYYQKTGVILAVNKDDGGIYILGGTFGSTPLLVNTAANLVKVANADPSAVVGVWRTYIPVATNTSVESLTIRSDGTYTWTSYGGKSGNWITGDSDYPVILIDTVENKQWKVAADAKHTGGRDIVVWDGRFIYYNGQK